MDENQIEQVTSQYSQNPITKKIVRVAAYVRVSHDDQKKHGLSLDAQKMKLQEFAEKNGLRIVEWYVDEGVSGRKLIKNRPELQRMIQDAEKKKFDRIIFIKLDRFFRSVAEYHECMKRIDPILWTATEEKYDLTTANGRAFVNMKLTIAELEADTTGERIIITNDYKVKAGLPLSGSVPFCFVIIRIGEKRKMIVKNPETAEIMEELLAHIWKHQSKRAAVLYINQKYGINLSYAAVNRLLKNTMLYGEYRGNPNYLSEENRYMTKDEFDRMNSFLTRQVKDNSPKHAYLFSGLIKCPHCGKALKASKFITTNPAGKKYPAKKYRCQKRALSGMCDFKKVINETTLEKLLLENLEKYFAEAKARAETYDIDPVNNELEIKELQEELDRLNYSWQKGRIKDVAKYDAEFDELTAKIEAAQKKHTEVVKQDFSNVDAILSGEWRNIYNALDDEHKRAFWRSFIESIEIDWSGHRQSDKKIVRIDFF